MSKGCIRVFRVRIGRCLVGAPSMLTSQWSPSARLSRQWRLAPLIGGRAGTDLQGQIRESHPGASEVTALYAMSTENSSVGSESVWPVVVTTVSKKVVPPRVYQTKVHVGVTARNVLEAIAQHHVPGYVEPVEVIGVAAEVEHVPVPASTRRQPCSPFPVRGSVSPPNCQEGEPTHFCADRVLRTAWSKVPVYQRRIWPTLRHDAGEAPHRHYTNRLPP